MEETIEQKVEIAIKSKPEEVIKPEVAVPVPAPSPAPVDNANAATEETSCQVETKLPAETVEPVAISESQE